MKDFFVVQDPPAVRVDGGAAFGGEVSTDAAVANNVRIRVNAATQLSSWFWVDASYNFIPRLQNDAAASYGRALSESAAPLYRIDDLRATLAPSSPGASDNAVILQNLDRLYVTMRAPHFDVYVGRQAVAWGSSKGASPTDVITPFLFTEIDTEDRVGVDAVRVRVPAGALGEVDARYVAGMDAKWKNSAAFVRGKTYVAGTDVALIGIAYRENALGGVDVTRAVMDAGVWCEAAIAGPTDGADDPYARVTVGADYSLRNATYLFLEYHYNGAGAGAPRDYTARAATRAYTDGAVYLLGRSYIIPGVSYPATPLFGVAAQLLVNLDDASLLVAPSIEYNVLENAYLAAGAFVGFGDQPRLDADLGEFTGSSVTNLGAAPVAFQSEFGAYPDIYFVSARYYF